MPSQQQQQPQPPFPLPPLSSAFPHRT
jgi:hypothetical protein